MDWDTAATVDDVIRACAQLFGARTAFVDESTAITFEMFNERTLALVHALASRGLERGARVAVLSQSSINVVTVLAACRGGIVPIPLNWRLTPAELAEQLRETEPAVLFYGDRYSAEAAFLRDQVSSLTVTVNLDEAFERFLKDDEGSSRASHVRPEDTASIIFTSGTTGRAKGVELSHAALVEDARQLSTHTFAFQPHEVSLLFMPLFHIGGLWYYMFPSFSAGATTIIHSRFDVEAVTRTIATAGVTNIHLVPTMLADLLAHPRFPTAAQRLRTIVYAGSSITEPLLRKAMATLPASDFVQSYGSTEGGNISALRPDDHVRAIREGQPELLRSCGMPLQGVDVELDIVDANDPVGEILVRSPMTMKGYWRQPELSAKKFTDGWFRTGDIGRFDENGFLYIVDRKNDMVITGGENVYPQEVEAVLLTHPSVAEAAVFGIPDPRWGEQLTAAIVPAAGATVTLEELSVHCRNILPGYKTPKRIIVLTSLPRSPIGKVLRRALRDTHSTSTDKAAQYVQDVKAPS